MTRTKHHTAAHDDETWMGFFRRWHEGEDSRALSVEAKVCPGTFHLHAARLKMRLKDLPEGHPAKRRSMPYSERPDWWREPNGKLAEEQWRALFALRAQGVPDTVLGPQFGVATQLICMQARKRGMRRADLGVPGAKGGKSPSTAARSPSPQGGEEILAVSGDGVAPSTTLRVVPLPTFGGEVIGGTVRGLAPLHHPSPAATDGPPPRDEEELSEIDLAGLGVRIRRGDWEGTADSFDAEVEAAGLRGDYQAVVDVCRAKESVRRAMFGAGAAAPGPPHPLALTGEAPPRDGEGERFGRPVPALKLRPGQRAPEGDWRTWVFLGGRGAGKTRAGAVWLADMAERVGPGRRLALIGPTLHDVCEVMIEGVSGLCSLPRWAGGPKPVFESSRRRLVFPNGAVAQVFSAEDPDSLRGPQFSAAWADEFCTWRNASETLALLRMGLRLALPTARGADAPDAIARLAEPRCLSAKNAVPERAEQPGAQAASDRVASGSPPLLCVTTTPRPTAALRALRAEATCVESHAGTADNAAHLSPGFLAGLEALYGGTRRAAQEIEGKVVELDGALLTGEMLAKAKTVEPQGKYDRIIVAIDPTTTTGGNACGIIVAGRIGDRAEVLADRSKSGLSPGGWARRTMAAAAEFGATVIVAEVNQGGEMVKAVLKAEGCTVRVREVRATKGKRVRAEPVAALYEQGRVVHRGDFAALEEELMAFGGEAEAACDLDRADALVWAVTDLLIDRAGDANRGPRIRVLDAPPVRPGCSTLPWWRE
ncbi:terminase large subunit domain-containing protein [Brevundimonas sp. GCM10030266]|uniref:phage terminase large subunit family protein n=1 Tax=Brevundimonas sp. GCM10030266 TaxID=3273386 RepID=UPI00360F8A58